MNTNHCDQTEFKSACARFPTGVTITTVMGEDGAPHGITVSSFTSVSLSPPLVLVCIDHRSPVMQHVAVGKHFGINVLRADQQELSIRFSRDWDGRFTGVQWAAGQTGVPLLCDVVARFECETVRIFAAGDHSVLIGKVLQATSTKGAPLVYVNRSYATAVGAG